MPSIKEEHWVKVWFGKAYQFVYQNWKWFGGALLGIILIVVLIVALTPSKEVAETSVVAENVAETVVSNEPEFKQEVRERFGVDNRDNADVIMQASQEAWVKVEDGRGNTVFSRVLVPGDVYYVPNGGKYKATFGNAGGVDIWVNGKLIPDVGKDHDRVADVSLAPDSLLKQSKK